MTIKSEIVTVTTKNLEYIGQKVTSDLAMA